ncbi:MAG: flagellar M-ring protein FliF [Myxococcales bacterium]|nr:flagellar M-ring protein FliF [Myxococcales bacterium]
MAETEKTPPSDAPASVFGQLRGLWDTLSPRRRAVVVAAVVGIAVLVGAMSLGGSVETYAPLYTGMAAEDAGEVVATLKERGISYRLSNSGTTISVPKAKLHEVRIDMASTGFPRGGGVGFEIFDKQNFGTTNFVEQVNFRRALQGEITRSIAAISSVKSARVHLAMGKRSVFRDASEPPAASVALRLKAGRRLSEGEVRGIVHLVASSVDGLEPVKVVVIDERGRVLSMPDGEDSNSSAVDLQSKMESGLEERVRRMVETVVGVGNAAVVVTAEMDFSRVDKTEEIYDKDKIAVRSEIKNVSRDSGGGGAVGGIAGARANLDGTAGTGKETGGAGQQNSTSETRNYEVPRILKHTVGPGSTVKRLHVAVLVNHKEVEIEPEPVAVPAAAADGKDDKKNKKDKEKQAEANADEAKAAELDEPKTERVPLTPEELVVISAVAREAAGLNDERGDSIVVQNVPFEDDPVFALDEPAPFVKPLFSKQMFYAASAVLALLLIAVVLFLTRRKGSVKRIAKPQVLSLPAPISEVERVLEARRAPAELPAPGEPEEELALPSQNGDLYGRVLQTVRADAGHAARVLSALLDESAKEGA